MRREAQPRLIVIPQVEEDMSVLDNNAAGVRMLRVVVPELPEMHVFTRDATKVFPGAAQRLFDPLRVLVGKRGAQIGLADAVRRQQRSNASHRGAADVGCAVGVGAAKPRQEVFDQTTEQPIAVERKMAEHIASVKERII